MSGCAVWARPLQIVLAVCLYLFAACSLLTAALGNPGWRNSTVHRPLWAGGGVRQGSTIYAPPPLTLPCPTYRTRPVLCSQLVRVRPKTRPAEYAKHPVDDHVFLGRINKLAVGAGVPEPYKNITRPAPGARQEMYLGGFLGAPASVTQALQMAEQQVGREDVGRRASKHAFASMLALETAQSC